jgi:hypothetical protein
MFCFFLPLTMYEREFDLAFLLEKCFQSIDFIGFKLITFLLFFMVFVLLYLTNYLVL